MPHQRNQMEAVEQVIFFLIKVLVGIFLAAALTGFFPISSLFGTEINSLIQWAGLSGICACTVFFIDWIIRNRRKEGEKRD